MEHRPNGRSYGATAPTFAELTTRLAAWEKAGEDQPRRSKADWEDVYELHARARRLSQLWLTFHRPENEIVGEMDVRLTEPVRPDRRTRLDTT